MEKISRFKKLEGKEISLCFVDNDYIQELNKKYRKIDKPTDVLSFPQLEDGMSPVVPQPLGDVVISMEKAKENSEDFKTTLWEEVIRLLVHGSLHLLGYDHEEEDQREIMEEEEKNVTEFINS